MHFTITGPKRIRKEQPGEEAASAAAGAIGFDVSLDARKHFQKKNGFGLGPDLTITGNFISNIIQKKEFMIIKCPPNTSGPRDVPRVGL
jgi:hypothetical protein